MNRQQPADTREARICGPCRIGECGHCEGNVNLAVGPGPAIPLLRCDHRCPRRVTKAN